jgi:hypothetical protein
MNRYLAIAAMFSTLALTAACGSSGISGTGIAASSGVGTGPNHHSRGACTPSSTLVAPANGLVADFSAAGSGDAGQGAQIMGGLFTYASPKPVGLEGLTYSTTEGHLNVRVNAPAIARPQFLGAVLQFSSCMDARAFTGVEFTISGSFSGCGLTYAAGDVEHEDATLSGGFATGPAGAYQPQSSLVAGDVTSTPRTLRQPFAGREIQGEPQGSIDPGKLVLMLWQFIVPVAADDGSATPNCSGNLIIDDVKFYR